jgi:hypothetical protein
MASAFVETLVARIRRTTPQSFSLASAGSETAQEMAEEAEEDVEKAWTTRGVDCPSPTVFRTPTAAHPRIPSPSPSLFDGQPQQSQQVSRPQGISLAFIVCFCCFDATISVRAKMTFVRLAHKGVSIRSGQSVNLL